MEFHIEMSLPLDSDGFLRRQCPACEREFKWLHTESESDAEEDSPVDSYFCPYCGAEAPTDEWWTRDQMAAIEGTVFDEAIEPGVDELRMQGQRHQPKLRRSSFNGSECRQ